MTKSASTRKAYGRATDQVMLLARRLSIVRTEKGRRATRSRREAVVVLVARVESATRVDTAPASSGRGTPDDSCTKRVARSSQPLTARSLSPP